jgi:hypothetical protein
MADGCPLILRADPCLNIGEWTGKIKATSRVVSEGYSADK